MLIESTITLQLLLIFGYDTNLKLLVFHFFFL